MSNFWTKKLEETRIGGWVFYKILPILIFAAGVKRIYSRRAYVKSMVYTDGDAILLGIALIAIALSALRFRNKPFTSAEACFRLMCFFAGVGLYVYVCLVKM